MPLEILDAPGLKLGDRIIYDIDIEGTVVLGRADDPSLTPFVLFTERNSEADRKASVDR